MARIDQRLSISKKKKPRRRTSSLRGNKLKK
jgi:hypothetical protein